MGPGHRATSNRCPSSVLWGLVHSIRVALPLVGWRLETGLMGKAMQWWKHNLRTGGCNVGLIWTLLLLLCGLMVEGWHCRRLASLIFLPKYREKYTYLSGNWTDVELKKRWNFVFCLSWACCLDVVLAPATAAAAEQAARVSMFLSWLLAADCPLLQCEYFDIFIFQFIKHLRMSSLCLNCLNIVTSNISSVSLFTIHESFKMTPKVNVSTYLHLLYLQSLPNT